MKFTRRLVMIITCMVLLVSLLIEQVCAAPNQMLKDKYEVAKVSDQLNDEDMLVNAYYRKLKEYGNLKAAAEDIKLLPGQALRTDGKAPKIEQVVYPGKEEAVEAIVWDDSAAAYSWQVDVQSDGLYQIHFAYVVLEQSLDVIYSIAIDDMFQCNEAESIRLKNAYIADGQPKENEYGDQMPANIIHANVWQRYSAYDVDGIFYKPLLFKLTKGRHTIKIGYKSGSIALSEVVLAAPKEYITYQTYTNSCEYPEYNGDPIRIEAESAGVRSRKILNSDASSDPSVTPFRIGKKTQNVMNGWNYKQGNDEITWNIKVPQDGKYKLAFRAWQNYYSGSVVYRQILVDGEVPFIEADAYPIRGTGQNFKIYTLGGDTPLLLNLKAGEHTITLRAIMGELNEIYYPLFEYNNLLSKAILDIQTITGARPDPNFNYKLEVKAPWIVENIEKVYKGILGESDKLEKKCGMTSEMVTTMRSYAGDLKNMVKNPRLITKQMSTLNSIQGQIGNWIASLKDSPLQLDYFELLAADQEPREPKVSFWTRIKVVVAEFVNSFRKNSSDEVNDSDSNVIDVWTSREREYGEVIQRLADEKFTSKTGIKVKVNILGAGSVGVVNTTSPLTLALVSGDSPDVVLGSDSGTPVELAIRKSSYDISKFDDFAEISKRFPKGAIIPFEYNGGTYALPDTIDFSIMLYRKDIIKSTGLSLPNTWDELTAKTLPTLRQFNLNFSINNSANKNAVAVSDSAFQFMMFYYQHGGQLYKNSNMDSTLDSDLAYRSFEQYTDLYRRYNIALGQNFYNQFNIGRIPLAVGGLYDYLQLDVAAPGISGKWDIAPIPGTKDESGNIVRNSCGTVTSSLLFDNNGKKDQGWEFLKWWTSDEIQIEFSNEIEALIGAEARWFSANQKALMNLKWTENGRKTVEEMLKWYSNVPNVLGGYMTNRAITNAFTRVAINETQKPRDAIEQAYKEIKAEILRKNREYGVIK